MIFGKPGEVCSIKGKQELYGNPDVVVQWDRFQEGSIIPETDDMTSIALMIEVFGKLHEEIAEKIKEINRTVSYYDAHGKDLLIYHDNLTEKWTEFQSKASQSG